MLTLLRKIKSRLPFAEAPKEDRTILAVCFGIALFFWLLIKLSKEYTVTHPWTITYELPQGKAFGQAPPRLFSVQIKAKGWNFLQAALLRRKYNLHFEVADRTAYNLSAFRVRSELERQLGDRDLQIVTSTYRDFESELVEQQRKKVPVVVPSRLSYAPEYDLQQAVSIQPDSVWVIGPENYLAEISSWRTDSLVATNLSQSVAKRMKLQPARRELRLAQEEVDVTVAVERFTEKSIFVPIEVVSNSTDSVVFFPPTATLKCVVGLSNFNRMGPEDFRLVADLTQQPVQGGKTTVALELVRLPVYLRSYSIHPRAVEFLVYKGKEEPVTTYSGS